MKRLYTLFFSFVFTLTCLVVPVHAQGTAYYDLMSLGYFYQLGTIMDTDFKGLVLPEEENSSFSFPDVGIEVGSFGAYELIISCSTQPLISLGSGVQLQCQSLGNNLYLYSVSSGFTNHFLISGSVSEYRIIHARFYPEFTKPVILSTDYTFSYSSDLHTSSGSGQHISVIYNSPAGESSLLASNERTDLAYLNLTVSDIQPYDLVSFNLTCSGLYLISAGSSDIVPKISTVNTSPPDSPSSAMQIITVEFDTSTLNKDSISLNLTFSGVRKIGVAHSFIASGSVRGFVLIDEGNTNRGFLKYILDSINNLTVNILRIFDPHADLPDEFEDDVNKQETILDDYQDVLDQVTRPDKDEIDPDITDDVSASDLTLLTSGINGVLSEDIFLKFFILALTICLVAYILYGKR